MGILIYLSSGLIEMALSDPIPFFGGTYQMVNAREIYEFTDTCIASQYGLHYQAVKLETEFISFSSRVVLLLCHPPNCPTLVSGNNSS